MYVFTSAYKDVRLSSRQSGSEMRADTRARRQAQIEEVAYRLLQTRGYAATSMLAVAREAHASNETLYRWYGDKNGLFTSMVENNARAIRQALEQALHDRTDPFACLEAIAPLLLSMVLGERAISLNRAAAADESGQLGAAIAAGGRETIFPLVEELMRRGLSSGTLGAPSAAVAAELFLRLLIGDQQIRRVIHVLSEPSSDQIALGAAEALAAFRRACAT